MSAESLRAPGNAPEVTGGPSGGIAAYVIRLRQGHRQTVHQFQGKPAYGICACGEPGCQVGWLLIHIDNLKTAYQSKVDELATETLRASRYADKMRENGWSVGHDFTPNPDYPDDGACVFIYDDFDGTVCDGLEDDHVA